MPRTFSLRRFLACFLLVALPAGMRLQQACAKHFWKDLLMRCPSSPRPLPSALSERLRNREPLRYRRLTSAASLIASFALIAVASGCAPRITRTGYSDSVSASDDCDAIIVRDWNSPGQLVGTVAVGDTGFSTNCGEARVLSILQQEACRARANVVVISEEKPPSLRSTCYRVTAKLIRTGEAVASSGGEVTPDDPAVRERDEVSRKRTRALIVSGVVAGVVGGLVAGLVTSL